MRKESIDNMKAFGITLVVIAHCISFYTDYTAVPSEAACLIASLCYSVNVAVFFILAGLLVRPQDIPGYYLKKIRAILVPFVVFSLLKIFYSLFITDRYVHSDTTEGIFRDAFLEGRLYWFVYTILILFLIAPLFWKRSRMILTFSVLVLTVILDTYLFLTGKTDAVLILQVNNVLVFLPYFLTGILLSFIPREKLTGALRRSRPVLVPLSIAFTVFMCFVYTKGDTVRLPRELIYPLRFFAAFPLIYLIYVLSDLITLKTDVVRSLGRHSLQIMLLDSFFRVVLFDLAAGILPAGEYIIWPVAVLDLIICLAVSVVCSKIPVVDFLIGQKKAKEGGKAAGNR